MACQVVFLLVLYGIIDEIYDDFDIQITKLKKHDRLMRDKAHEFNSELQKINNRTCENCKYFSDYSCNVSVSHHDDFSIFSCNKWESK